VDQPFALGRIFGGEGNLGLGVELSYLTPLPWYAEVIGSVNQASGEGTTRSFYGENDLTISSLRHFQYLLTLRQFFPFTEQWSLMWGLSGMTGPNPSGPGQSTQIYATDLYLRFRSIDDSHFSVFTLQTEWFYRRRNQPTDVLSDTSGFAQAKWNFARRWAVATRYEYGSPVWNQDRSLANDDLDPFWTNARQRVSANLTFWPTEFSRIRAQVSSDIPQWEPKPIWAGFLTFEFVIGAHGAHAF
jgi:hypothetical protein